MVSDFAMIYNFGGYGKWNDWECRRRARLDGRIIAKLMNIALLGLFGLTVVGLGIISFEKWLSETLNTKKPRLSAQEIRLLMQIVVSIFVVIAALYIILSGSL